jgi:hypothetical protein
MACLLSGPVPPEADVYWVDEKTVPQYIKQQRALMLQTVRSPSPGPPSFALMRLQWKKVLPALVFVHIPVSLLSLEPTVEQETQHRLSQVQKADVLAPLYAVFSEC